MNILFIAYPDMSKKNGGSICTKVFIDLFKSIAHDFHLLIAESKSYAWDFTGTKLYKVPPTKKLSQIKKIFWGAPHRYLSYLKKNKNIFNNIDLVVLSSGILGYGIPKLLSKLNIPFIALHHNYEPRYHHDNRTKISLYGLCLRKIFKAEDEALKRSILNIALTKKDASILHDKHNLNDKVRFIIAPAIIDADFERPTTNMNICNKVVISGALHDHQTIDGVIFYLEELNDIVLKYYPNTKVIISGRNPPPYLKKKCSIYQNIELIENPLNMDDIIKDAMLYINPTRLGSGLKLRNVDALKFGCPVIAHDNSCSGYETMIGKGIFGFTDKNSFEYAIKNFRSQCLPRQILQSVFFNTYSFQNLKNIISNSLCHG